MRRAPVAPSAARNWSRTISRPATKMTRRRGAFAESERWKRQRRRRAADRTTAAAALGGDGPAVSESGVVVDFVKAGVDIPELLADALDEGTDVGAVAIGAAARQEILAVHEVVELAIGDVLARLERELRDHPELRQRQIDGGALPESGVGGGRGAGPRQGAPGVGGVRGGAAARPVALRGSARDAAPGSAAAATCR